MNNDLLDLKQNSDYSYPRDLEVPAKSFFWLNVDYLEINLVLVSFLEAVLPAGDWVSRGIVTLGVAVGSTHLGPSKNITDK